MSGLATSPSCVELLRRSETSHPGLELLAQIHDRHRRFARRDRVVCVKLRRNLGLLRRRQLRLGDGEIDHGFERRRRRRHESWHFPSVSLLAGGGVCGALLANGLRVGRRRRNGYRSRRQGSVSLSLLLISARIARSAGTAVSALMHTDSLSRTSTGSFDGVQPIPPQSREIRHGSISADAISQALKPGRPHGYLPRKGWARRFHKHQLDRDRLHVRDGTRHGGTTSSGLI